MKKSISLMMLMCFISLSSIGQKLSTRSGYVKFYSETPLENIEAQNNLVSSVLDLSSGKFAFLVKIKSFQFEKALMQEHFNENYMKSSEFPKATFKGAIENFEDLDFTKDGEFTCYFKGTMQIKGVDKEIREQVTVKIKEGVVYLDTSFKLRPGDYGVEIPATKKDNIADNLALTLKIKYEKK